MERNGFLTDDHGTPSAMRLAFVCLVAASIFFGVAAVAMSGLGWGDPAVALEAMAWTGGTGIAGKGWQKALERGGRGGRDGSVN